MPRFSVVVPTRDRPDLLSFCLESLAGQTFEDVEVIVSDNPTSVPARDTFDRWARSGWRYVRADRPLPMHENFERGCAETTGDYVAVVIDKTVLHPSALEFADRELAAHTNIDIVTWWNEGFNPVDEDGDLGAGRFVPTATTVSASLYDPRAELALRFANQHRRGVDPVHYVRGKIVFGAYSRTLLSRIRRETGRVFHPLAPDYTAMVPACGLAERALDLGRPLLVSYNSVRSNGRRQGVEPAYARSFIEAVDPAIVDALPISGLYTSVHNVVAYDLVSAARRCPPGTTPPLDFANLLRRAREDLAGVVWDEPADRAAQYAILEDAEARVGIVPERPERSTIELLARIPLLPQAARWARRRRHPLPPLYPSPVEAARTADLQHTR